ncbi:hypothetical protein C8R46DRAFT_1140432 [Mycena filopes]|nr:hypothetical protein C8R46DRAFT_1140432 [Mycena filopes]
MSLASVLPVELEREIFETAATDNPSCIPELLLVARRVHLWIEPLRYRVIPVNAQTEGLVKSILCSNKPPEFFRNAIRHLAFSAYTVTVKEAHQLLKLCPNIVSFACRPAYTLGLLPILTAMNVRRLGVHLNCLFGFSSADLTPSSVDFTHPAFRSLTHLEMLNNMEEDALEVLPHIPTLPALTHLLLNYEIPRDNILAVLAQCPRLQLLLVLWPFPMEYEAVQVLPVSDARFVTGKYGDYWAEWEEGARGFPDFWSRGDDFLARKRNGEIEAARYWMD